MKERRTNFVKLYINQVYYGLYTNLEEMEKEWLTNVYENNQGNLYKCSYPADLNYLGSDQQTYKDLENSTVTGGRVYDLQTNKSADDYTNLVELITELNHEPDSAFGANITQIVNADEYMKALVLDVATGNWDNYAYNKNNYYLYDNPATNQFNFIAYDADNTFGVSWENIDWATRNCLDWTNHSLNLPLAQKLLAVPVFYNKYKFYLDSIARYIINPDSVFQHIEALKQLITPAAIADTFRCLDYHYTISDFNNSFDLAAGDHIRYGIKPFLTARKQAILNQLNSSAIDDLTDISSGITVAPNPAYDDIFIQLATISYPTVHCRIIDLTGKILKELSLNKNGNSYKLSLSGLKAGMYILFVQFADKDYYTKFIKK
jgi:hypothetical protein